MSNNLNKYKVQIGHESLILSGSESIEHLQEIAMYIKQKTSELETSLNDNVNIRPILVTVNIADELIKYKNEMNKKLNIEINDKDKIIEGLKKKLNVNIEEKERLKSKIEHVQSKFNVTQKELKSMQEIVKDLDNEVTNLKEEKKNIDNNLKEVKSNDNKVKNELKAL